MIAKFAPVPRPDVCVPVWLVNSAVDVMFMLPRECDLFFDCGTHKYPTVLCVPSTAVLLAPVHCCCRCRRTGRVYIDL